MDFNFYQDEFDQLCDELRFKIYSGNPDLCVLPFLKENFPYLVELPESTGWTVYPPGPIEIPQRSIRSVFINQHPFIKTTHKGAKMDFLTKEWSNGTYSFAHVRVSIYFADRMQAKTAQGYLTEKFREIGAYARHSITDSDNKVTLYKDLDMEMNLVSILLKEHPDEKNYSLLLIFPCDYEDDWKLPNK